MPWENGSKASSLADFEDGTGTGWKSVALFLKDA